MNIAQILLLGGLSGLCLWLGGTEAYDAYADVYADKTAILVGIVENEDTVGNHGNYTVVTVNGEQLYNPAQRFPFQIGALYEIEYYEKTKYITSVTQQTEQETNQ